MSCDMESVPSASADGSERLLTSPVNPSADADGTDFVALTHEH
jgi:hypothetical protein